MTGRILNFLLLFTLADFMLVNAVSFEEDTALSAKEAEILFRFRDRVRPKLPHKYMEESIYLVKWLRAKNFDMSAAEDMLFADIKWRAENRMDKIDYEDWRDFKSDFAWNLDGVDKEGRPMVQVILKEWDIRNAMVTGRRARLNRWVFKYFEDATRLVRKFQEEGKNVTQFTLIMDAEGFNPVNHGCPLCLPFYIALSSAYEDHYPGSIDKIHVLNTPEFFRVVIRLVWPVLSQGTRQALTLHGTDRNVWKSTLSKTIDNGQLLRAMGGNLIAD